MSCYLSRDRFLVFRPRDVAAKTLSVTFYQVYLGLLIGRTNDTKKKVSCEQKGEDLVNRLIVFY